MPWSGWTQEAWDRHRRQQEEQAEYIPPPSPPPPAPAPIIPPTPPPPPVSTTPRIPSIIPNPSGRNLEYVKALFPHFSAEDQAAVGTTYGLAPTRTVGRVDASERSRLTGQGRANEALTALEAARSAGNFDANESGYVFLTSAIGLLRQYGGEEGSSMSRDNYTRFSTAMSNLFEEAKEQRVDPFYMDMAQTFLTPSTTFSSMMPTRRVDGRLVFGEPSRQLYR